MPARSAHKEALGIEGLTAVLDALLDPHVVLAAVRDDEGKIVDFIYTEANRAACEFNGLAHDELVGKTIVTQHPAVAMTAVLGMYSRVVETGEPLALDDWVYPQDLLGGEERRYDLRVVRFGDGIAETWRDVTDRYERARAVTEERARLDAILHSMAEGINVLDLRTNRYVLMSPSQVALTGFTAEEMENLPVEEAYGRCHPDDRETSVRQQQALARGEPGPVVAEYRWKVKSGEYRWFRDSRTVISDDDGNPVLLVGVSADITDLMMAQEKLRELNDQLEERVAERTADVEEALRAKDEFLRNMSHELRTPLNSVIGFSDILVRGIPGAINDEQHRQLAMINSAGHQLLSLVEEVLDLSKIESGGLRIQIRECHVADIMHEVIEAAAPGAELKGLVLRGTGFDSAGSLMTDGDCVIRILNNLVGNAIKFTGHGSVVLAVSRTPEEVVWEVADTGSGMSEHDLEHIFEDFYQATPLSGAKAPGTGVGLALSRRLTEALGGSLSVMSELGKGSTFALRLPLTAPRPE